VFTTHGIGIAATRIGGTADVTVDNKKE